MCVLDEPFKTHHNDLGTSQAGLMFISSNRDDVLDREFESLGELMVQSRLARTFKKKRIDSFFATSNYISFN